MPGTDQKEPFTPTLTGLEIAVTGMAVRFPGAPNVRQFWDNLKNGVETISFYSREELEEAGVTPVLLDNPNFVAARGDLEDSHCFDAAFFGYTPAEAKIMDPQLRVYHECVWSALEDAGYEPGTANRLIGVYTGAHPNVSWITGSLAGINNSSQRFDAYNLNSSPSFGTRISFNLNLNGPSFTVQTACSTSLVAIHLGCQGLLNAECDVALAGGVSITGGGKSGYIYQEGMINSPDGHCRPFDANAAGTVGGSGAGVVVLKRLEDALEDNDHIYAIVKGTAINNDGNRKVGYTAPSIEGQADAIKAALETAEIDPETVTYIESHGTGTSLGDPIEIEGLKLAFESGKRAFCAIGAVKSNFGHLDNAAGVAGFIKTALSIHHRMIAPTLHFEQPNPGIDFENSPFFVNNKLTPWNPGNLPLRAGVSSFGIGGTNAHAVLEEVPRDYREAQPAPSRREQLFLLSARTRDSLNRTVRNMNTHFSTHPGLSLPDAAYTLQTGRKTFKYRAFAVCNSVPGLLERLTPEAMENGELPVVSTMDEDVPAVFMFSGQGAQYAGMGRELYHHEPVFRDELDKCFDILEPLMGYPLRPILFPGDGGSTGDMDVNQTEVTQPLIFAFEYALARLLETWGIKPAAMTGHSIGEYTAACLSGVLSLDDALVLVALRGRLMQGLPSGAMLSVSLPPGELEPLLPGTLSMAAVNGPSNCVVSGTHGDVAAFAELLEQKGHGSRPLHTSHAFHSHMMEPILPRFRERAAGMTLNPPQIPYVSNVTGTWITGDDVTDPAYWTRHLRGAVRFYDGLTALLEKHGNAVLVEVGPGRVLSTLSRQHPKKNPRQLVLNLVRHPREEIPDDRFILSRLGQLWQKGVTIDWNGFYRDEERRRVPLPAYSFEPQYFRPPSRRTVGAGRASAGAAGSPGVPVKPLKNADISKWFYVPAWKGVPLPVGGSPTFEPRTRWLVFIDADGPGETVTTQLRRMDQEVITVGMGEQFAENSGTGADFLLEPGTEEHYDKLFEALKQRGAVPDRILHFWNVTGSAGDPEGDGEEDMDRHMRAGFYSLLYIARASGRKSISSPLSLDIVSDFMHDITGGETIHPVKSAIFGPVGVIPREYANIKCRGIDIQWPGVAGEQAAAEHLLLELSRDGAEPLAALRRGRRWVREVEPYPLESVENIEPSRLKLKKHGVYLITGGLGGIGLTLAGELARKWRGRLVLTCRTEIPEPGDWQEYLDQHVEWDNVSRKINDLRRLEKEGADVLVCSADVSNPVQMAEALRRARERFGGIDGVIHAAGVPDGAVMQARSAEITERVLAPKIKGTILLDQLTRPFKPGFFLICSSLSAIMPPAGHVAYCAANSFQDYFSYARTASGRGYTVSVNWDTWLEVGMAVDYTREDKEMSPASHPLLDGSYQSGPNQRIYFVFFEPKQYWVLDEHRIQGKATLPGTGYMQLLGAAFEDLTGSKTFEIRDLLFLAPLTAEDDSRLPVNIVFIKEGDLYRFKVISRSSDRWHEHAVGSISALNEPSGGNAVNKKIYDTGQLIDRCNKTVIQEAKVKGQKDGGQQFLEVGPRWHNLASVRYGENEGLAEIYIPEAFEADLTSYPLHPALMDTATSFMLGKLSGNKPFLPFMVKRVKVHGPLPERFYSYSVPLPETAPAQGREHLRFNVSIMNEAGQVRVEVDEFTLVHIAAGTVQTAQPVQPVEKKDTPAGQGMEGINSIEGIEVFNRLMAGAPPQVIISTTDFHQRVRFAELSAKVAKAREEDDVDDNGGMEEAGHPRPELSTPYVAPSTGVQKQLAKIWQRLLGIDQIGIKDDFFELGGDSLKGLTVVAEVQKRLKAEISITGMFTYPTIETLAANLGEGDVGESKYAAIETAEEKTFYPLSSAQQRLYFLQQLRKDSVFYNIPQAKILDGELDVQVFENAFREVINRHESLRTTYHMIEGEPVQRIETGFEFSVEYIDGKALGTTSRKELREIVRDFVRPFDLSEAPLLRVGLVKIEDTKHLWIFDIHHISADATGFAIVQTEAFKLINGEELQPLRIQYKDFSTWQNNMIQSGQIKKQEDYWMSIYPDRNDIPRLNLPTDFPRPEQTRYEGEMYTFKLGSAGTGGLKDICSKTGTTLYINLMTVLYLLLYKYTGQEDIIVGSSINGRPHADLTRIVGMFVNMLAIRSRVDESMTYTELLDKVKTRCLEAFENQDMQFELLVDKLNLDISSSRNPLFDVCLNFMNYIEPSYNTVRKLKVSQFGAEYHNAKFDMLLWAADQGDDLRFSLEYSTELFKRSTAEDFSNHILEIIKQVVDDPGKTLKSIKISHKVVKPKAEVPQIDFGF